jgi:3D (Asp-Asp-Asp) domain-containing protein
MKKTLLLVGGFVFLLLAYGWHTPNPVLWNSLEVTVTAYNSTPGQTSGDPFVAAWGDRLEPGMACVAVSRDLIPLGLGHEAEVYLEGIGGPYVVLDKMNARFEKRIDVYYGVDVKAAREFGEQEAMAYWR